MQEVKRKYRRLLRELKECEKISSSKTYFLAQAVHDLRQPLQALHIYSDMLLETQLNEEQRDIGERIKDSTTEIKELLNNYLDISKLDYGGVIYEPCEFCLKTLTDKLAKEYQTICAHHHKNFHYIPCRQTIHNDPILIERMLRNFLSNAVKFSKSKVVFGCRHQGKKIIVQIIDNGEGIPQKEIPYIFDEFYQSRKNPHNRKHGAGLGLAIAKKIADIIGSKIEVSSKEGQGTTFSFSLE